MHDPQGREWHYLSVSDSDFVKRRFTELHALHMRTESRDFTLRMGQTAEIAVLRSLQLSRSHFVGHFEDLDDHDDSTLYRKHDPDAVSGELIRGGRVDFVQFHPEAGPLAIEVKNIREWIYPDRSIVRDLLGKCVQIDAVPVLVARRIAYSTYSVLTECGVIIHQFYNQLYPYADSALADAVRPKLSLGYFDVRVGNQPDARMAKFFQESVPVIARRARERWGAHRDEVQAFCQNTMSYAEFVAALKGREWHEEAEP